MLPGHRKRPSTICDGVPELGDHNLLHARTQKLPANILRAFSAYVEKIAVRLACQMDANSNVFLSGEVGGMAGRNPDRLDVADFLIGSIWLLFGGAASARMG